MPAKRAVREKPSKLTLRTYQVGFGDCFLLTWHYPQRDRHVLIDFGSNGQPKSAPTALLKVVAADIATECGGKLDAVILTHRHKDHIAGFTTAANGKGPGDIIRALKPDLVVQPWTEAPNAKPDAKEAPAVTGSKGFVASLENMQSVSAGITQEARRMGASESAPWRARLFEGIAFLGEEGIQNASAVENLRTMGKRNSYVSHLYRSGLETILPGVGVTVLGPPTLRQSAEVGQERSRDANEFWMMRAAAADQVRSSAKRLFPRAAVENTELPPPWARWFLPRARAIRADNLLAFVRIMDDALNNTSVILLFEIAGKAFLFPGDAQIENWNYTLKQEGLMKRLAKVTFYKVGHHGSRNATPKTLWNAFENKGAQGKRNRLQTVVSTMAGKYGKLAEGTEVPRASLVRALNKESDFFSTQTLRGKRKMVFEFTL